RVRRRRLTPDAAWLAGDDRRRDAPQPHASLVQERRLPHLGLTGHPGRAVRRLRPDGEGRGLPEGLRGQRFRRLQAPLALDADRRGSAVRRAPHGPGRQDADDRPRRSVLPPAGRELAPEAPQGRVTASYRGFTTVRL